MQHVKKWFVFFALWGACKPEPVSLVVSPNTVRYSEANDVVVLKTVLRDVQGQEILGVPCSFMSQNLAIVQARPDGSLISAGSGATEIIVQCAGMKAVVPARVGLPVRLDFQAQCATRCAKLSIAPPDKARGDSWNIQLEGIGGSANLVLKVLDFEGQPVSVPVQYELIDTDSRNSAQAMGVEIHSSQIYGKGIEGKYLIVAIAGKLSARGRVETVMPAVGEVKAPSLLRLKPGEYFVLHPETFQRTPQGLKSIEGARISFTSRNSLVAEVSANGTVQAKSVGNTEILAIADSGAFAQIMVTVGF